jgi:hypothetical protein
MASLAFGMLASQAQALSCMPTNLAELFNRLQASEKIYTIGVGKIRLTPPVPRYVYGQPRTVSGEFQGRFMGRAGLGKEKVVPLTVQSLCAGEWCGGLPEEGTVEYIAFLRQSDGANILDIDPCPEGILSIPTDQSLDLLQRCMKRGKCSDADVQKLGRR